MKSRFITGTAAAVLALVLVLAGCGGGGEAAALSKRDFVRQGNVICARAHQAQMKAFGEFLRKNRASGGEITGKPQDVIETIALPRFEQQIEELKELGVPTGDETEVEAIIRGFEKVKEEVERNPASVSSGSSPSFAKVAKLAGAYGLTACTEGI